MRKMIFSFIFILAYPCLGQAGTQQLILGGTPFNNLTATGTTYLPFEQTNAYGSFGQVNEVKVAWPCPGTLSNLKVYLAAAPGGGTPYYTFTLYQNGGSTALTTGQITSTSGSDTTDSVTVAAGDILYIEVDVSTPNPTAVKASFSVVFTPTSFGQTVLLGYTASAQNQAPAWNGFAGATNASAEADIEVIIPCAGTIENLYVSVNAAPGGATSWTYTVDHNGSSTSLTATISGAATSNNDTAGGHAFTVAAGDTIDMAVTKSGSPAASWAGYGVVFVPNTPGQFILPITAQGGDISGGTYYGTVAGRDFGGSLTNSTEAQTQLVSAVQFYIQAIYVQVVTAPGSGKKYTFTLRDNGGSTGLNVQLQNTNTTANNATNVLVSSGDLIDTQSVPTGSPAAPTSCMISYLGYIVPTSNFFGMFY